MAPVQQNGTTKNELFALIEHLLKIRTSISGGTNGRQSLMLRREAAGDDDKCPSSLAFGNVWVYVRIHCE